MQSVPKIVLKRLNLPAAGSHPDADLLTAFAERSLAGPERDHVVQHLARCGDCREVVSLALPPQVELQPVVDGSVNWFGWTPFRGSALRWAAVAAGLVLISIASIGTLQYRRHRSPELASNAVEEKSAIPAPAFYPPPSAHPAVPRTNVETGRGSLLPGVPQNPPPQAAARKNPAQAPGHEKVEVTGGARTIGVPAETAQITTPTTAQNEIYGQPLQNEAGEQTQSSADRVDKAKPATTQASPNPAPEPLLQTGSALMKSQAPPRWAISASGALQRSSDGGQTWLGVNVAAKKQSSTAPLIIFRAVSVSSNAGEVWTGGSGGALYHSVDGGNRWLRVTPSTVDAALSGDILSIQFSDAQNGTVTTSTAEVWTTPDAGQTWHKQP
jgi:hypothetical protein